VPTPTSTNFNREAISGDMRTVFAKVIAGDITTLPSNDPITTMLRAGATLIAKECTRGGTKVIDRAITMRGGAFRPNTNRFMSWAKAAMYRELILLSG
jgi:hypothetical protein